MVLVVRTLVDGSRGDRREQFQHSVGAIVRHRFAQFHRVGGIAQPSQIVLRRSGLGLGLGGFPICFSLAAGTGGVSDELRQVNTVFRALMHLEK